MIFKANSLSGSTILVTGASSGIGRTAAELFSQMGATLIITGRNTERLEQSLSGLHGDGHRSIASDLHDMEATAALVAEAAATASGLDGIFHCAGAELVKLMRLVKQNNIDDIFGAAVNGALGIAKAAGRSGIMKPNSSIVFMSSVAAQRGQTGMAVYSSAKSATDGLVRSLACEFAPKRIRVNAIAAGGVETAMHDRLTKSLTDDAIEVYRKAHPLGFGTPDDVANMAAVLLSSAGQWITGAVINVDGGYMAS